MVRVLIGLRQTVLRHQARRTRPGWLVAGALFGLVSAVGTLLLGVVRYDRTGAGPDVLALVFFLWVSGRVTQNALTGGDTTLRPELFALLPIPRRRLAAALLLTDLADPALAFFAVAYTGLVVLAGRSGVAAAAVGVVAAILLLMLTGVLSTLAGGALGPGSRRGHDVATVVTALGLSAVAVTGTLFPALASTLTHRSSPALTLAVRALPTGWGPAAVDAAAGSHWTRAALLLAGQAGLITVLAACWPRVLTRRMNGAATPSRVAGRRPGRSRTRTAPGGAVLPATPTGAVLSKELRLWARDPIRLTCLLIAVVVGAAVCAIPRLTAGTTVLLPFAGLMTVVIAAACASNLHGADGPSLWTTIMSPHSSRPDIRGRQYAWLVFVGPYAVAATVALTALSGQRWAWPWVLSALPALLGGGAGLAVLASVVNVLPLDDTGGPTPAFSLKVHLALVAVTLTAVPSSVLLFLGHLQHQHWLLWTAVPVGLLTGALLFQGLGAGATRRLQLHQVDLLRTITDAASPT